MSHSAVREQESRLDANARNCGTGSVAVEETIVIVIKVPKSMKRFKTPEMLSCEDLKTGPPASKHCQRNKASYAFWYHQRSHKSI